MREILFRAKRLDNSEWVYGYYAFHTNGLEDENYKEYHIIQPLQENGRFDVLRDVDPETIGQFTGLTDKNDSKIFEGDIVNYPDTYLSWSGDVDVKGNVGAVEWGKRTMCFYFSNRNAVDMEEFFVLNGCMTDVEVIGNIHDNPELIGGADNGL